MFKNTFVRAKASGIGRPSKDGRYASADYFRSQSAFQNSTSAN